MLGPIVLLLLFVIMTVFIVTVMMIAKHKQQIALPYTDFEEISDSEQEELKK